MMNRMVFIGATVNEQDKNGRIYSSALTDFNGNFSLKGERPVAFFELLVCGL